MDPGGEQFARLARFAALMAGAPDAVPLGAAALAMSAVLRSRPTDAADAVLDDLAASCATPTFEGVRTHLFEELGFAGEQLEYDHPRNSFLDVVVERRRGLPILLATVFIEVAARAGVGAVGIGMPMHFLVRAAEDTEAFVDPFTGQALDRAGARRRFEALAGGRVRWDDRHLAVTPERLIVVRMLANLKAAYERRADRVGLAQVALMRAAIPELEPNAGVEAVRLAAVFN
jgi:regulator of sirC expression with transglutaminase-like and TPR domain